MGVQSTISLVWQVALIIGLAVANFYLLFARHGLHAHDLPHTADIYRQALTLAYATLALAASAAIVMNIDEQLPRRRYSLHNRRVWTYVLCFVALVILLVYIPAGTRLFGFHALSPSDWFYALGATAAFIAIREFQRWDRKHRRKVIHALHHEIYLPFDKKD